MSNRNITDQSEPATSGRADQEPVLRARNVKKYFSTESGLLSSLFSGDKQVKAVNGIDINVYPGETVGIVGESGCGKTTLGRCLARLYEPTEGSITFDGEDVTQISGSNLRELRSNVQYIFQDPEASLNPRKTVGEIIGRPLQLHQGLNEEAKVDRVIELLEEVGLDQSYMPRYPHELSGGQQQRIGIARALTMEPRVIVADEPVSALDASVQAQIINLLKRLQSTYNLAYVFIAHDLSLVKHISDRVLILYLGQVMEQGPTENIYNDPQHPYTRSLLSSVPRVKGDTSNIKIILEGDPPSPMDPPSGCPFHTRCPEYIGEECSATKPDLEAVEDEAGDVADPDHFVSCHWNGRDQQDRPAFDWSK